jgi:hypothetical protein
VRMAHIWAPPFLQGPKLLGQQDKDCSHISGLDVSLCWARALMESARRLLITLSGSNRTLRHVRFCQRRSDLFAITLWSSQSALEVLL